MNKYKRVSTIIEYTWGYRSRIPNILLGKIREWADINSLNLIATCHIK
jgi:hypothetical protein